MPQEYSLRCIDVNPHSCLTDYNCANIFVNMKLSERLKKAREYAGLTQKELEEKSGVLQQMISKIENGHQETSAYIVQLAMACGVRAEWLAVESGEMVDGLYVESTKIKRAVMLMQEMPEYALDEAIASINSMAKLTEIASKKAK